MNSDIQNALKLVNENYKYGYDFYNDKEINEYWNEKDSFTWENLCEFASMTIRGYVVLYKFTLVLLIHLLETNQYHGEYEEKLKADLPRLKEYVAVCKCNVKTIFDGRYDEVVFITINDALGVGVRRIANTNTVFREIFIEFVEMTRNVHHQSNIKTDYYFPLSTGSQKISSYKDINSETFWNQVKYYQELYADDDYAKDKAIKTICRFYRWLVSKYSDYNFFE